MKRTVSALGKLNWTRRTCAVFALCAATAAALPAQIFMPLYLFGGTNGNEPMAGLVQGTDGSLYGTTAYGGPGFVYPYDPGSGTVFRIGPRGGALTPLHNFCTRSGCADGEVPSAGLVQGADGSFYGTTTGGGTSRGGTVFRITPGGTLATLYNFCSQSLCTDGSAPGPLIQAADGEFFGTTAGGGAYSGYDGNGGSVFKMTPSGTLTTLYSFCAQPGCTDGYYPAGLVQATNEDFYGTTVYGGANGFGTVFKITASGALTTLYSFCAVGSYPNCTDGAWPYAGLVQATNGDFYGTTSSGGAAKDGTLFKITPSGTLKTLYNFDSPGGPHAALVQGTDGNLYGTAGSGGTGTAFKITLGGTLTTLYTFSNPDSGSDPNGLVQATDGDFYGTTNGEGDNWGTVFGLSVGLGPFVKTLPHFGAVGAAITILGTDLTGATSVSFNGTPAAFEVVSATEIRSAVPGGATTGSVQVTTPRGTLASGGPFLVAP
jgi:uncharacterized repeat protein (TIGR03803 family)